MKFIRLTQGKITVIDTRDWLRVSRYKRWHAVNWGGRFYAATTLKNGRKLYLHRLLLNAPADAQIDHINGNTLDNRRSNLRISTASTNQQNRHRVQGHIPYKGVYRHTDGRFIARIKVRNTQYWLGSFKTALEAARAYDRKARYYFGAFARVNFPQWK
jgi:hypothetical protein